MFVSRRRHLRVTPIGGRTERRAPQGCWGSGRQGGSKDMGEASVGIDSIDGGIRASFKSIPDAPIDAEFEAKRR